MAPLANPRFACPVTREPAKPLVLPSAASRAKKVSIRISWEARNANAVTSALIRMRLVRWCARLAQVRPTPYLGFGSVAKTDCGCSAGYIDIDETVQFDCVECGEGLTCPALSQLKDLKRGASDVGEQFTPKIKKGS